MDIKEFIKADRQDIMATTFLPLIESAYATFLEMDSIIEQPLKAILLKIISNLESANILIFCYKKINESKILIRSAIESTILFCYLVLYPEEMEEYVLDSELLKFKNLHIAYKQYKIGKEHKVLAPTLDAFSEEKIIEENEKFFNILQKKNKKRILKIINKTTYTLNAENFKKLDEFFKHFKPMYSNFEKMYKELNNVFPIIDIGIRFLVFEEYNKFSQVTHGSLYENKLKDEVTTQELSELYSIVYRCIIIPCVVCKEKEFLDVNSTNYQDLIKIHEKFKNML